jgi:hypothetical protein
VGRSTIDALRAYRAAARGATAVGQDQDLMFASQTGAPVDPSNLLAPHY